MPRLDKQRWYLVVGSSRAIGFDEVLEIYNSVKIYISVNVYMQGHNIVVSKLNINTKRMLRVISSSKAVGSHLLYTISRLYNRDHKFFVVDDLC